MDDRINAGLLFVLLDQPEMLDPAMAALAGVPGIERISWWNNVCPHRRDWLGELRTIAEFETLGICELAHALDPSLLPRTLRTIQFRRYPRPSQGVLRLPTRGLSVVMISPRDLDDSVSAQSLRDWGDFIHFPGIVDAGIPGYGLVTPYENTGHAAPRFLHLYEFPDPDAEAVFQRTRPCVAHRFGGGPGHPSFDEWELHPEIQINYVNSFQLIEHAHRDAPK
jgi:hypothetical protein